MLNDNARRIRSWDIKTGQKLAEMRTPKVGGQGFNQQWEGMALQRNEGDRNIQTPSLRGTTAASYPLILHMVLDTPPQVWSIAVSEQIDVTTGNVTKGSFVYPPCAPV